MSIDASVVVPTFGGARRLPELLEALATQRDPGSWELIVVVDGQVDGTREVLESWRDRLPLRTVAFDENRGVVAALNEGFAAARGRVLIRCDDDLTPPPDFIARHVAWHSGAELIGVIGLTRNRYDDTPYARAYGVAADARARVAALTAPEALRYRHWAANNSLTQTAWELVGGFDPRLRSGEDWELGYRLVRAGVRLVIDPSLEADHRGPARTAEVRVARAFVAGVARRDVERVHSDLVGARSVAENAASALAGRPSVKARTWGATMIVVARFLSSRERGRALGRVIDRLLGIVPSRVGGILVALGVESAALAGHRSRIQTVDEVAEQKRFELLSEHRDR